jgi:hypothetical protein
MMSNEILDRLRAIPPLPAGAPRLYAWPGYGQPEYEAYHDEWARITSHTSLAWRGTDMDDVDREVSRCQRLAVKLCIVMSPPVPDLEGSVPAMITRMRRRWDRLMGMIDGRAAIGIVLVDLEGFRYAREHPRPWGVIQRDRNVHRYNNAVYDLCKEKAGRNVPVMRYGHLAAVRGGRAKVHYPYTNPLDAVDGGFCAVCYHTSDSDRWQDELQVTIDHARLWNVHEGWLWTSLGVTIADWQTPGIDAYPRIGKSANYAVPYDPQLSWRYGAWLGRPGNHSDEHAEFARVHSVAIWPGLFREGTERTCGPHLCAFLEGLCTREPFDERLRELQVELWNGES